MPWELTRADVEAQGWRNDSRGGGTRPWGPRGKRSKGCLKGPKTTYTTIAISEKQSKRSKMGSFSLYIGPPGPTQEMKLMGPGGEGFSSHVEADRASCIPSVIRRFCMQEVQGSRSFFLGGGLQNIAGKNNARTFVEQIKL